MFLRLASLLTPITSTKVPQSTLRISNLLERLKELTENCYTQSYDLLQWKDTSAKGKSAEKSPEEILQVEFLSSWKSGCSPGPSVWQFAQNVANQGSSAEPQ